jgi:hypothetical protein
MSFTFSSGSKSLSIKNAFLGIIPKRLGFTMLKNSDFLGSLDSNPYDFRHYKINSFALNVNGKQIPSEALSLNMSHEKLLLWVIKHFLKAPVYITQIRG